MAESRPDIDITDGDGDMGDDEDLISPTKSLGDKSETGKDLSRMTDSEDKEIQVEQLNPTTGVSDKATKGTESEDAAVEEDSGDKEDGLSPGVVMEEKEGDEEAEEEGEEGREAVAMPSPMAPSRKEREQHELTHTPYRSWCPHCVRARGRNRAHRASKEPGKTGVPRISFDYFFFNDEDEKANKNLCSSWWTKAQVRSTQEEWARRD